MQFGTSATPIINSPFPRLDAFGNLSLSFTISTVRECASHMDAWSAFYEWLNEWKTAGKGEWTWTDEAVIADAEPKVQGLRLIVSYNFTLGRLL